MKVALFINGEPPNFKIDLRQYDYIHCTDGALHYLSIWGIDPDIISGDFDSGVVDENNEEIEIISTPDQNFTDFEKALQILYTKGAETVHVYGASGRQQDHFLGNLSGAYRFKDKMTLIFFDNYSYYFFADKKLELDGYKNRTISLYPFPEATNIVTKGLAYPLSYESLNILNRIGTRNVATEDRVTIEYESGDLIVFVMND
ncbi:thiamine diphosphokinase [Vaginella massiliensis]|uniref:thiamine diphosphokinase n=1 Tax=Vaginella massiliensis TaxID=1816680 RepID=UPI0008384FE7|nr:thiamine diphosphokinase [Vaginella massiliensis]